MSVYCQPSKVFETYLDEVFGTTATKVLAEDIVTGIQISMYDDCGYPSILVTRDGATVDFLQIADEVEAEPSMRELYQDYLDEYTPDANDPKCQEDAINDREAELTDASVDFLSVVLGRNITETERRCGPFLDEFIDHTLEWLYKNHSIDPYRPMILEDEKGEEFYEEYPYSCLEFD